MIQLGDDASNSSSSSIGGGSSGSSSSNRWVGPSSSSFNNSSCSSFSLGRLAKAGRCTTIDSGAGGDAHGGDQISGSTFKIDANNNGGTGISGYSYSGGGGMTALTGETAATTTMTLDAKAAT